MRDQASPVRRMMRGGAWVLRTRIVRCAAFVAFEPGGCPERWWGLRPVVKAKRGKP